MKKTLQIAAGIVVAAIVVSFVRLAFVEATFDSMTRKAVDRQARVQESFRAQQAQRQAEKEAREARIADEKRREREAACYVITSDGRKLTC